MEQKDCLFSKEASIFISIYVTVYFCWQNFAVLQDIVFLAVLTMQLI